MSVCFTFQNSDFRHTKVSEKFRTHLVRNPSGQMIQRRRVERIGTQEASNLASHDIFSGKTSVDRSRILVNVLFIRFSIC